MIRIERVATTLGMAIDEDNESALTFDFGSSISSIYHLMSQKEDAVMSLTRSQCDQIYKALLRFKVVYYDKDNKKLFSRRSSSEHNPVLDYDSIGSISKSSKTLISLESKIDSTYNMVSSEAEEESTPKGVLL